MKMESYNNGISLLMLSTSQYISVDPFTDMFIYVIYVGQ